jgi:carbonic anhydrase
MGSLRGHGGDGASIPDRHRPGLADKELTRLQADLKETPVAVINNGHTVEEEYRPGSSLTVGGVRYDLKQFHFHTPSEHTVHGAHAAHGDARGLREHGADKFVVIGVLFDVGKESPFLSALTADAFRESEENMSRRTRGSSTSRRPCRIRRSTTPIPARSRLRLLGERDVVRLKERAKMSADQLAAFHRVLGDNSRPVQKANRRVPHETVSGAK